MTEQFIRHLTSVIGTLLALVVWLGGYIAGSHGWWWAGFAILLCYSIVYTLLEV